jgi:hypothetical protein
VSVLGNSCVNQRAGLTTGLDPIPLTPHLAWLSAMSLAKFRWRLSGKLINGASDRFWAAKRRMARTAVECPGDAVRCKAVRSGARLIWDKNRHRPTRGEHDSRAPVHRRQRALLWQSWRFSAAGRRRRRNAAARSRLHCRQRHRCSLRSIRRLPSVSWCPLPQWLGIFSRRILRRSILGNWTTAVLLELISNSLLSGI